MINSIKNKKYKIYWNNIASDALDQFYSALRQDFVVQWALMPDWHSGYSLPIWWVMSTQDVIVPAWVWYDIGCGVCAYKTWFTKNEIIPYSEKIFNSIYRSIPTWEWKHHTKQQEWLEWDKYPKTGFLEKIFHDLWLYQIWTLWWWNHFIEIDYDHDGWVWILIHSWSRWIWHKVASNYMKIASWDGKAREWHYYLEINTENGKDYIKDMNFCLEFALQNRENMIKKVYSEIHYYLKWEHNENINFRSCEEKWEFINRNHNHADLKDWFWIHRKWATHAENWMLWVIPGNMRDWSFIVKGKGNPDSLFSSSHWWWRVMSRTKAKQNIDMKDFKKSMDGIVAKVQESTLDESPYAYKNIFEVMELQKDLIDIIYHLKPIINVKA